MRKYDWPRAKALCHVHVENNRGESECLQMVMFGRNAEECRIGSTVVAYWIVGKDYDVPRG